MKAFTSFLSLQMEEFIHYRKAAGNWNGSYEENLKLFAFPVSLQQRDEDDRSAPFIKKRCGSGQRSRQHPDFKRG